MNNKAFLNRLRKSLKKIFLNKSKMSKGEKLMFNEFDPEWFRKQYNINETDKRKLFEIYKKLVKTHQVSPNPFFDEKSYLQNNPDVREAVLKGQFLCGFEHFVLYGRNEGRRVNYVNNVNLDFVSDYENVELIKEIFSEEEKLVGYIDHIRTFYIYGWIVDKENLDDNVEFVVSIDGKPVVKGVANLFRQDLLNAGIGNGRYGFKIGLPLIFFDDDDHLITISVKDKKIISKTFFLNQLPFTMFYIYLYNNNSHFDTSKESLTKTKIIIQNSSQQQEVYANSVLRSYDFIEVIEVEVPSLIWNFFEDEELIIRVVANEKEFKTFKLKREEILEKFEKFLAEIDTLPLDDFEIQYKVLHTLEHLSCSNLVNELSEQAKISLCRLIERLNLWYLFKDKIDLTTFSQLFVKSFKLDNKFLLLNKLLKQLNLELVLNFKDKNIGPEHSNLVYSIVQKQILHNPTTIYLFMRFPELKYYICLTLINLFCLFEADLNFLNKIMPLSQVKEKLKNSKDAFSLSLRMSLEINDENFEAVEQILYELPKSKGWLNAPCILYTIKKVKEAFLTQKIDAKALDKLIYAYIYFLDNFEKEDRWFSRLYNVNLIQGLVEILHLYYYLPEWTKKDLIEATIRVYGLCPEFWRLYKLNNLKISELEISFNRFNNIANFWEKDSFEEQDTYYLNLYSDLIFFKRYNNVDVYQILREILIYILSNKSLKMEIKKLYLSLLDNYEDLVGILSHPLIDEETYNELISTYHSKLPGEILKLYPVPKSSYQESLLELGKRILNKEFDYAVKLADSLLYSTSFSLEDSLIAVDFLNYYAITTKNELLLERVLSKLITMLEGISAQNPLLLSILYRIFNSENLNSKNLDAYLIMIEDIVKEKLGGEYLDLIEFTKNNPHPFLKDNYFSDTLVVVYSCQKNLSTRIKTIKETWLKDLEKYKIPYIICVGGSEKLELKDNVLYLPVPDEYEFLPQKSLALYEWIFYNTQFMYVYKIDDDSLLNAEWFFSMLSYRKHNYYGRIVKRNIGGTDRSWHQQKSKNILYRTKIDKSYEPSIYAEGSTGYSLSRIAIDKLIKIRKSEIGQIIENNSIMEDKLVGDLLKTAGITPQNENYLTYIRRKTFANATPVGIWENRYFSSKIFPAVMVHLDNEEDIKRAYEVSKTNQLKPYKVYPTCHATAIFSKEVYDYYGNGLEMLSSKNNLIKCISEDRHLIAVVRNEKSIIHHFLNHYRKLGIKAFFIVDNLSDDGTREYLLEQPDVVLFSTDMPYKHSHYGVLWQQAIMSNFSRGKWVLLVDADEFLIYEDWKTKSISQFIKEMEEGGYECLRADLIEFYPKKLEDADFEKFAPFDVCKYYDKEPFIFTFYGGSFDTKVSTVSSLRYRLASDVANLHDFTASKFPLFKYKPWIRLSEGIHFIGGVPSYKILEFKAVLAHFKFNNKFPEKVKTEVIRKQHFEEAREYKKYLIALSKGEDILYDPDVSVEYVDSKSLLKSIWRFKNDN
ncbi:glycosyltransferase family 2 protein [Thermodesulfobacterium sp. TA1]|uniref:glycosyltransferase family 2 protein n=1 Tax=Thermodesulfobacterium sp. TA1 TaxID=2234087 RepID=UPI001231F12F|nr:glycosyltransferase family 2 protein [Thermodesulfobacterium sp. TA1]QER41307.1 glycosyltransferase family 2 protein [Thermodesulfobacterium sp. TA1]